MTKLQKAWVNEDCLVSLEYNPEQLGSNLDDVNAIFHMISRGFFDTLKNPQACATLAAMIRKESEGQVNFNKVVMHD